MRVKDSTKCSCFKVLSKRRLEAHYISTIKNTGIQRVWRCRSQFVYYLSTHYGVRSSWAPMSRRLLVVVPGSSFWTGEMAAHPSRGARLSPLPGLRGALVGTAPLSAGRGRVTPPPPSSSGSFASGSNVTGVQVRCPPRITARSCATQPVRNSIRKREYKHAEDPPPATPPHH